MYFGPPERPLFGWYHAPTSGIAGSVAAVICPPLGHEYINSHRTIRHLADRCAARGVPTLRFDYDGTGDSAGADEDPDRLLSWLASITAAITHLRERSCCVDVGLIGLRFGATLAALTAGDHSVACLALWAPCVRGQAYVRELRAMQLTSAAVHPVEPMEPNSLEAGGFVFTEQTVRELRDVTLLERPPRAARILISPRDDLAEDTALRDAWSRTGLNVEQRHLAGYAGMMAEPHNTVVPHSALEEIATWVAATGRPAPTPGAVGRASPPNSSVRMAHVPGCRALLPSIAQEVREELMRFGPDGARFGVISEPVGGVGQCAPTILLPNAGAVHHVGPNRLYVLLARALAAAGFRCLRLDLAGLGDSVVDDLQAENDTYLPTASAEVALALDALEADRGSDRVVLMGLCSGAHTSFHAGLDLAGRGIAECVLINPLTFYYKRGMPLDQQPARHFSEWQDYMLAVRDPVRWRKLLIGRADMRHLVATLAKQVRIKLYAQARSLARRWSERPSEVDDLESDLLRLLGSGSNLSFVFARDDPGYPLLMTLAGSTVKRLIRERRLAISFIERADHTFSAKRPRCQSIEQLVSHLARRYCTASAPAPHGATARTNDA
jgi:alpha-beta hydrolase superfamily lysophospholipase